MKYLVTGGGGFIGSGTVRRLIEEGHDVTTIDNFSTGKREAVPNKCLVIEGDVSDPSVINQLGNDRFEAIIHMAGQSSGEVSFDDPIYDLHTNTQSTILLLKHAKDTGCRKFVYASSMSVYGDHNPPLCREEACTVPRSFYAVGKLASENYMRIFSDMGIACTALRLFNVYGVGQNMDNMRQGMVSIYLSMAIRDKHIVVKGSKDRFRDFVYIDDVVEAVIMSLKQSEGYEVFNVCTGISTTVERVVEMICRHLSSDISVEYMGCTPGDQFGIVGSNEKIRRVLGWQPKCSIENGMAKMIDWAQYNIQ